VGKIYDIMAFVENRENINGNEERYVQKVVCSWCKKSWTKIVVGVRPTGSLEISHGICTICEEKMNKEIDDLSLPKTGEES